MAYAGHFGPIADVRQRAEELKAHHQARPEALLALLDGPKTAWELSLHLFPQELDPAGRRFAFAETLAHLEYLREEGAVGRGARPTGTSGAKAPSPGRACPGAESGGKL